MFTTLQLNNFRQHKDRTVDFVSGLNALRGLNEAGKSGILESMAYAMFGVDALREPLDDVVTWGEKVSSLKVKLNMQVNSNKIEIRRGKSGAEIDVDGKLVATGQKEVTRFVEGLLGAAPKVAAKLMLANQASNELIGHTHPTRMGNAHPNIVPYQVFPTRDGHMVLAIGNDGQFERFCLAAGHPNVAMDPAYQTNPERVKNRQALIAMITAWTIQRDTDEWGQLLERVSVPCSPILDVAQVMTHPHVLARGMRLDSVDPTVPPMIANPMLMDGQRMTSDVAPPQLGGAQAVWGGQK